MAWSSDISGYLPKVVLIFFPLNTPLNIKVLLALETTIFSPCATETEYSTFDLPSGTLNSSMLNSGIVGLGTYVLGEKDFFIKFPYKKSALIPDRETM